MPKKIFGPNKIGFNYSDYLRKRELGLKHDIGYQDRLTKKFICSLDECGSNLHAKDGGIFNLEFSLDGSILAVACEKKSILLYDVSTQKQTKYIENAHLDCVNCIRFLDENSFASGSDDNSVKTWDLRYLKTATRVLLGHSNWVKNIEFSSKENRLITSAFDGGIYSWDLNNFTEQGVVYDRAFLMDGLMRMKLSPDGTKMILCTTHGYILIIHNVNLQTLNCDLQRFKPNIYRLMQESEQNIPLASCSTYLFSPYRKTNRVELVSDFPNTAEVISSLQIHPMGWCALSRNISSDELSEWTSVHDIQERDIGDYLNSYTIGTLSYPPLQRSTGATEPQNNLDGSRTMDLWMGFITNQNIRAQRMLASNRRTTGIGIRTVRTSISVFNSGIIPSSESGNSIEPLNEQLPPAGPDELQLDDGTCKIMQNLPRLTHFIEESNAGKGFIKELCFSSDGRIICSPHNTGVRLFSFNNSCSELSVCVPERPQKLYKLAHFQDYHSEIVVSCKFNPYHWLLVSGCLGGQIIWYSPVL